MRSFSHPLGVSTCLILSLSLSLSGCICVHLSGLILGLIAATSMLK